MPSPMLKTRSPGIYRRGRRYVVVARVRGRQVKRSAATLAEARVVKAALTTDVRRGEYREQARVTLAEYAPEWAESYTGRTSLGIGDGTRADYRSALERDAIPCPLGHLRLSEIEPRDLKRFATDLARRGLAPSSVAKSVAPLRALLATAVEEGLIRSNPAASLRLPRARADVADAGKAKALTPDEFAAIHAAIPHGWQLFFRFLLETGLRVGESIQVRFGDFDFGCGWLTVERQFYRGTVCPPKSRRTRRVRIAEPLVRELWRIRGRDDELVFMAERGGRIVPSNLMSRTLKPAAVEAGLGAWSRERGKLRADSWVGFHTFRHTCATTLFRSGWNPAQVARFLGHTDPRFTLRTYVHLLDEDMPEPVFGGQLVATRPIETSRTLLFAKAPRSRLYWAKAQTGRDWPRSPRLTRNEGVPGSSPGVGFEARTGRGRAPRRPSRTRRRTRDSRRRAPGRRR